MKQLLYTFGAVAVIGVITLAFVLSQVPTSTPGTSSSSSGGSTSVISEAGANRSFIATYVSSISLTTFSTTSAISGSATTGSATTSSTSGQSSPGGSFTYTPSNQVKVISVIATATSGGALSFSAQYENIGGGTIYVLGGGGSSLSATFTSGGSLVSQVSGPKCAIATVMMAVSSGSDHTSVTPGCWSGFHYQLQGTGNIEVTLTLAWSDGADQTGGGSIDINAYFTLT